MDVHVLSNQELERFKRELLDEIRSMLSQSTDESTAKQWLRSAEVRKMLGISPGTLQNLRVNGTLPYRKIGGSMFYARQDIERMMKGGSTNG